MAVGLFRKRKKKDNVAMERRVKQCQRAKIPSTRTKMISILVLTRFSLNGNAQ